MPPLRMPRIVVLGVTTLLAAVAPGPAASQTFAGEEPADVPPEAAQALTQAAAAGQEASASASSSQVAPMNTNISIRLDSPGDQGAVIQTNSSSAEAIAANANTTSQDATQEQSGGAYAGGQAQSATQVALTSQDAAASAASNQIGAMNTNIGIRINSPGEDGSVTQKNSSSAEGIAANASMTSQDATQEQWGGGSPGEQAQSATQVAAASQSAAASAGSNQVEPANTHSPAGLGDAGGGAPTSASSAPSDPFTWTWIWLWNGSPTAPTAPSGASLLPASTSPATPGSAPASNVSPTTWIWIWIWNWVEPALASPLPPVGGDSGLPPPVPQHGGGTDGVAPSESTPGTGAPSLLAGAAATPPLEGDGGIGPSEVPSGGDSRSRAAEPARSPHGTAWLAEGVTEGLQAGSRTPQPPHREGKAASGGASASSDAAPPPRHPRFPTGPQTASASAGTASGNGGANGLLAVLTILIALAAPALGGRLRLPSAFWRLAAFVSPLERPG
jgi:hypothetical protein